MPSTLPTDSALTKAVKDFGLGTYDSPRDSELHGEDDEKREPEGESLPQEGGPLDPFGPDRWLSYPEGPATSQGKHASAELPGDEDRPPRRRKPAEDTKDDVVPSIAQSELPSEQDNPSARADYYDDMQIGKSSDNMWADEDTGAYVSNEVESLPTPAENEMTMKNWLDAVGNAWSGYVVEDQNVPRGFPSEDFRENVNFPKTNDPGHGGRVLAGDDMRRTYDSPRTRQATDLQLVEELTKKFLKDHGKTNITRRAVTSFLQNNDRGDRQYLASDIIRCLKLKHKISIPDVLDIFPVSKTASRQANHAGLATTYEDLINLEIKHLHEPEAASAFRRCAANLARVMADLRKVWSQNG